MAAELATVFFHGLDLAPNGLHPSLGADRLTDVFSIHQELVGLTAKLHEEKIPYALCGALALAVHGYPRATLDIDLLALANSAERLQRCARVCGFKLEAAPMIFAAGMVRIQRLTKVFLGNLDVLMLDVLTVAPEIEKQMTVENFEWQGARLRTLSRASLKRLKSLRGNAQDIADLERLG